MASPTQVSYNADRAAKELYVCLDYGAFDWVTDEAGAINIIKRAKNQGWLPELEKSFKKLYSQDLHEYVRSQLNSFDSEMGAYARTFKPDQAVADAKNFFDRVSCVTDNTGLRDFIHEISGYDPTTGGVATPERLVAMREVYEKYYAKLYSSSVTTVSGAIKAELDGTGYYSCAQDIVDTCEAIVAAQKKAAATVPIQQPTAPAATASTTAEQTPSTDPRPAASPSSTTAPSKTTTSIEELVLPRYNADLAR